MITIDLVNDYEEKTEKPQHRSTTGLFIWRGRPSDPIYNLASDRHAEMIQVTHQARLARAAQVEAPGDVSVDVQRYTEKAIISVSLVERYARRIFRLAE